MLINFLSTNINILFLYSTNIRNYSIPFTVDRYLMKIFKIFKICNIKIKLTYHKL